MISQEFNKINMNVYIPKHYTVLNQAVKEKNIETITHLLKSGADPNGVTNTGISRSIPLTCIDFTDNSCLDIIFLLTKYGADVNKIDLTGHTLLTYFITSLYNKWTSHEIYTKREKVVELLLFLLKRGCNPDGTIFNNPLCILLLFLKKNNNDDNNSKSELIIVELIEILLSFSANPLSKMLRLSLSGNTILSSYNLLSPFYITNNTYYTCTVYGKIKNMFVITANNNYEEMKKYKYLSIIYTNIIKQKQIQPVDSENIVNDELLSGLDVYSFDKSEIIILNTEKNNYCFHISEIPYLLSLGKNPYTQIEFPESFKDVLLSTDYYPIPNKDDDTQTEIKVSEIINYIEMQLRTYNPYIDMKKILNLNMKELEELKDNIYSKSSTVIEEKEFKNKSELLVYILTLILILIKNNDQTLSYICLLVDCIQYESDIAGDILRLFPIYIRYKVAEFIVSHTFTEFLDEIPVFLSYTDEINVLYTETIDKFMYFLEELSVSDSDINDDNKVFDLYRMFVKKCVFEKLDIDEKSTTHEQIDIIWNDVSVVFQRHT